MPLNDYEFSYRALTFGGSTAYEVVREAGITDMAVRLGDRPFTRGHGWIPGLNYADGKYIEFEIIVTGTMDSATLWNRIQNVIKIFSPFLYTEPDPENNDQLNFKYPGADEKFIRCRPTKRTIVREPGTEFGVKPIAVQLFAYDPRWYDATEVDSGVTSGTFNVTNSSTFLYAYPRITFVTSGGGNAKLTNNTNGDVVELSSAGPSASVEVRMDRLSYGSRSLIVYTGVPPTPSTDKYDKWVAPRLPFKLNVGVNSLTLNTGTSVRIRHYTPWG
jgi:hypothetical protein